MPSDITIPMLLLSVLIGYALGIFSGLVPGIHTNNFALMLVALSPMLMDSGIPPTYIAIAILANSLSHTFHDIIPAVYLGAPNDDMALAVLPGHRLLLEGFGSEAIRLSALGSAGSVAFSLIIAVPLAFAFSKIYPTLQNYLGLLLLLISISLILSEKGEYIINQGSLVKYKYKAYALILFVLTGILGLFAFRMEASMHPLIDFGSPSILLPLLSGLFGASQLLISLLSGSHIPPQRYSRIELPAKRIIRGVITGSAAGSIVAWLPGISSSIAAVLARLFIRSDFERTKDSKDREKKDEDACEGYYRYDDDEFYRDETMESSKEFIVSVSGVNTANVVL
ncbi:tripartite tricarboxylate transporter permease [Methanococcoides sp. AM1]|uniref:tripartite tricarboxylate transporter permease n=1 Tax=Methanococcoides sp. AM1 TaxID=1201011 RepID=UPI001FCE90B9|nr:tripartite tricarboxylate transporter permease [Methanococcoides sp. AM1]